MDWKDIDLLDFAKELSKLLKFYKYRRPYQVLLDYSARRVTCVWSLPYANDIRFSFRREEQCITVYMEFPNKLRPNPVKMNDLSEVPEELLDKSTDIRVNTVKAWGDYEAETN